MATSIASASASQASTPGITTAGSTTPSSSLLLSPELAAERDRDVPVIVAGEGSSANSYADEGSMKQHPTLGNQKTPISPPHSGPTANSSAHSATTALDSQGKPRIACWGHRGASAHLPENTLASFRAAIKEGAEGIESDVHATTDHVILMFHDPTLDRTTTGKGKIKEQAWAGQIEHVRTTKEPIQPIPRLEELVALIMEPDNMHAVLNIDCKIQNDPETLFPKMAEIISAYPDYATRLSPRIILGLWHPLFINPAKRYLPTLTRFHIGISTRIAKKFFWKECSGFSIAFSMLVGSDGQAFLRDCKAAGKEVTVWTVNDREEMITAAGWGVKAILTDKVQYCVGVRDEWERDSSKLSLPFPRRLIFPWTNWKYYSATHIMWLRWMEENLTKNAYKPGSLEEAGFEEAVTAVANAIGNPPESEGVAGTK